LSLHNPTFGFSPRNLVSPLNYDYSQSQQISLKMNCNLNIYCTQFQKKLNDYKNSDNNKKGIFKTNINTHITINIGKEEFETLFNANVFFLMLGLYFTLNSSPFMGKVWLLASSPLSFVNKNIIKIIIHEFFIH